MSARDFGERRRDIDGLRAVAILGVLAYHLGIGGVTGGYGGVDVFFVISGFLIAGIIKSELDSGSFSLAAFYVRRVRRILPALVAMLLVTTAFAVLLLFPNDFKAYGRSLLAACGAVSNYVFAHETGYFSEEAASKPLLHTWSLGVEEQFYAVFPVLLALLYRWRRDAVLPALAVVAALSFAYSVRRVEINPQQAFFVTPTRVWELLVGALLAWGALPRLERRLPREIAGVVGIALIAFSYFFFSEASPFPGFNAIPLCFGAALIIWCGGSAATSQTAVARLLSTPPAVSIGLISYSIYLWHWPLLVLLRYRFPDLFQDGDWGLSVRLALVASSIALGALSWRFVERPFLRSSTRLKPRAVFFTAAMTAGTLAALAFGFLKRPDWFQSWPADVRLIMADVGTGKNPSCASYAPANGWPASACVVGDTRAHPDTVLWGDSHAAAIIPGIAAYGAANRRAVIVASFPGCPPLDGATLYGMSQRHGCSIRPAALIERVLKTDVRRIIVAARWALYAEGTDESRAKIYLTPGPVSQNAAVFSTLLEATARRIADKGREVVILGPIPEQTVNIASAFARYRAWHQPLPPEPTLAAFLYRQRHVMPVLQRLAAIPNVRVVYPHLTLCTTGTCRYSKDGTPIYRDSNHLNRAGTAGLGDVYAQIFADAPVVPVSQSPTPVTTSTIGLPATAR